MKNLTEIHVVGGKSLAGNISIQGSKNAALPMMAAALMHRGLSILKKMSKDFGCILYGRDTGKSGSCYLVGGS